MINRIGLIKFSYGVLLLGVSMLLAPSTLLALTSGGVGGYPAHPDPAGQYSESWFIYILNLEASKKDAIIVTNS